MDKEIKFVIVCGSELAEKVNEAIKDKKQLNK